jgi:O-antigen ligase
MLFENPIFGVGETGYYRIASKVLSRFQAPHNVFIELLIYTGVVGFILYSFFLYQIFKKVIQTYKHQHYILPGILFLMTLMLFLNGQGLFIKLVWLIFAVNLGQQNKYYIES